MAIQAIGSTNAGHFVTFRQLNHQAVKVGEIAVAKRMHEAHPEMLGMSGFEESTERAFAVATDKIEKIMQRDDGYTEPANQNTQPPQGNNYAVVATQNQVAAASAYSYFK